MPTGYSRLEKEVKRLFSLSENISTCRYSSEQIVGLPAPVQRYFRYALQENQSYISYVRLKHGGEFRPVPGFKWFTIKGVEYFTVDNPGFYWSGKIPFARAADSYIDGKGHLQVWLISLLKIINARGQQTDQGELYRWLAETPWFPTALLPSERLKWEVIDNRSARIIFSHKGLKLQGVFHFNEQGQITLFETKRYMDKDRLVDWSCCYNDYQQVNNLRIPFFGVVAWKLILVIVAMVALR